MAMGGTIKGESPDYGAAGKGNMAESNLSTAVTEKAGRAARALFVAPWVRRGTPARIGV
jgi:hypothetical protein